MGDPALAYTKPRRYSKSLSRSNVELGWIGGVSAPVEASTSQPACASRVCKSSVTIAVEEEKSRADAVARVRQ